MPKDVGTTPRAKLTTRQRLQVWEQYRGICVICERHIDGVRDRWIVEHVRALELGGEDNFSNMGPAHEHCGWNKTQDDHRRAGKAKRQKQRHLGIRQPLRPVPGSRQTPFKRKLDGTVLRRNEARWDREAVNIPSDPSFAPAKHHPPGFRGIEAPAPCQISKDSPKRNKVRAGRSGLPMSREETSRDANSEATIELLSAVPHHLNFLFEDRPLLNGESADRYDALRESIVRKVKPTDVIEAIWVKDLVDLIWEASRLRRWRGQILDQARQDAARTLIAQEQDSRRALSGGSGTPDAIVEAITIAQLWLSGKYSKTFEDILQQQGLTTDDVMAEAFRLRLAGIERIDRMSAACDLRRDALFREIERKRATHSQQMRSAAAHIMEAEILPTSSRVSESG